jgi:hypothetical protein
VERGFIAALFEVLVLLGFNPQVFLNPLRLFSAHRKHRFDSTGPLELPRIVRGAVEM